MNEILGHTGLEYSTIGCPSCVFLTCDMAWATRFSMSRTPPPVDASQRPSDALSTARFTSDNAFATRGNSTASWRRPTRDAHDTPDPVTSTLQAVNLAWREPGKINSGISYNQKHGGR